MLQATVGFKTNDWKLPIFFILSLGIILLMFMLCEMYKDINKAIKEKNNIN
jgi:hypothetical protein